MGERFKTGDPRVTLYHPETGEIRNIPVEDVLLPGFREYRLLKPLALSWKARWNQFWQARKLKAVLRADLKQFAIRLTVLRRQVGKLESVDLTALRVIKIRRVLDETLNL